MKMRIKLCVVILLFFIGFTFLPIFTFAASQADIDRMTTFAVILGRAIGCGINTEAASRRVGAWMDKKFPPGSQDQKTFLPIFLQGIKYHAQQQANGKSPDTCSQVKSSFGKMQWP